MYIYVCTLCVYIMICLIGVTHRGIERHAALRAAVSRRCAARLVCIIFVYFVREPRFDIDFKQYYIPGQVVLPYGRHNNPRDKVYRQKNNTEYYTSSCCRTTLAPTNRNAKYIIYRYSIFTILSRKTEFKTKTLIYISVLNYAFL